jgi:hypothetical protein
MEIESAVENELVAPSVVGGVERFCAVVVGQRNNAAQMVGVSIVKLALDIAAACQIDGCQSVAAIDVNIMSE